MKMSKKFITLKPLSGIFKETMEPYQRMSEKGEMSPLLEIDGSYYRILRTTIDGLKLRKIVVCREDGQIEKNEKINRKAFQFYLYLSYYSFAKKNISFDIRQGGKKRHEPIIQSFQTVVTDLTPILSIDEQKAMEFHLHYLNEIYRLSVLIASLANDLSTYWKQVEKTQVDKLSSMQMTEISNTFIEYNSLRHQLEAILFEDGKRARETVQTVLKKRKYKSRIRDVGDLNKVLKEMQGATGASKRYVKNYKKDYKSIEISLGIKVGSFTMEKLICELNDGSLAEKINQMNMRDLIDGHWILSPNCIYK